jgi:C-terminal processing protease CtpA/Prc
MRFFPNKTYMLLLPLVLLSACGGSGVTDKQPTGLIPSSEITYVAGTFTKYAELAGLCVGTNNGSALTEKLWLRSWSDDTYLWYNEINDQDPAPFSVTDYFDALKTTERTASGKAKDQFHFSMSTEEWELLNQSGASVGFGINFHLQQGAFVDRKIIVTYTEPNSPASAEQVSRGAVVVAVDGVVVETASTETEIATLNNGLFPESAGQTVVFTLLDLNSTQTRDVELVAQSVVSTPVQNVQTLATANGKIGYLQFNSHIATAEKGLVDAVTQLKSENITDLVVDLRYNGGGLLALASQLGYMIAGSATTGKTFEKLTFNDKYPNTDPVTGQALEAAPFYDQTIGFNETLLTAGHALPTLELRRLFVLTTDNTCSASESLMNSLRGINVEVIQIGKNTCGKPYGFYPTPNCKTTYFTVQFKGENELGFGDYADGFTPSETPVFASEVQGCVVEDDYNHNLGDANEAMLSAAITYSESSVPVCPAVKIPKVGKTFVSSVFNDNLLIEDTRGHTFVQNNRILTFK